MQFNHVEYAHLSYVHGEGSRPGLQQKEGLQGESSTREQQVRTPHWICVHDRQEILRDHKISVAISSQQKS